ncbi:hypothetical protein FRC19_000814, partial [Serendipita sp. 401]
MSLSRFNVFRRPAPSGNARRWLIPGDAIPEESKLDPLILDYKKTTESLRQIEENYSSRNETLLAIIQACSISEQLLLEFHRDVSLQHDRLFDEYTSTVASLKAELKNFDTSVRGESKKLGGMRFQFHWREAIMVACLGQLKKNNRDLAALIAFKPSTTITTHPGAKAVVSVATNDLFLQPLHTPLSPPLPLPLPSSSPLQQNNSVSDFPTISTSSSLQPVVIPFPPNRSESPSRASLFRNLFFQNIRLTTKNWSEEQIRQSLCVIQDFGDNDDFGIACLAICLSGYNLENCVPTLHNIRYLGSQDNYKTALGIVKHHKMDLDRAQDLFLRVHRLGGGTPEGYTTALSIVFASCNLEDALLDFKGPGTPSQCHHDYSHAPRFLQSQAYEPQSVKEGRQEMREEHGTGYFKALEYMEESEFSPDPKEQEDGSENNMGSSVNNTSVYEDEDIVLAGDLKVFRSQSIYCGRYSTVYLGVWNKKQVAVKVIQTVISLHKTRRKFRRESQIWARLQHPNILPFLGVKEEAGFGICGALISPWCPHGSSSYIQQLSGMPVERMRLVLEVANGVKYLHSREPIIVHGDLKPANILIDEDGSAKICDFGLIRLIKEEVNTGMTTTTLHTGTTRYLSRELVTAKKPMPTMASDCHAFGCIALE